MDRDGPPGGESCGMKKLPGSAGSDSGKSPIRGRSSCERGSSSCERGSMLRTVVFSILGFLTPICVALYLVPRIFPDPQAELVPPDSALASQAPAESSPQPASLLSGGKDNESYARGALGGEPDSDSVVAPVPGVDTNGKASAEVPPAGALITAPQSNETSSAYLTVASNELFDPKDGSIFIIAARFTFESLPKVGKRSRIAMRYDKGAKPYPGWALAIRRFDTSIRPEMYWESGDGKGGWLTFDHVNIVKGVPYQLTLIARGSDLMSMYLEDLSAPGDSDASADDPDAELTKRPREVVFAGGYPLNDMKTPHSEAPLYFAPQSSRRGEFRGALHELLIARVDEFPLKRERLTEELKGGMPSLLKMVGEEARILWVYEEPGSQTPRDSSSHHFPISISEVKP